MLIVPSFIQFLAYSDSVEYQLVYGATVYKRLVYMKVQIVQATSARDITYM